MKAYLILVGSELLNGAMIDTNSIYMASELNEASIEVSGKIMVHDKIDEIVDVISYVYNKVDLVILSGGLGPTVDDITKEAISSFLKKDLSIDEFHKKEMIKKFAQRGIEVLAKNLKEVSVVEGSKVFHNEPGIAPAFCIDKIAAFPGVPVELKNMFPKYIAYIKEKYSLEKSLIVKDFIVWGIPESVLEEKVISLFTDDRIFLEFLVKDYGIVLRLVSQEENKELIDGLSEDLYEILGEAILYEGNRASEEVLVEELINKNLSISLAESCTGGLICEKLVSVSGASQVLYEGLVTYSNKSKIKRLGVENKTLDKYGAVSEEIVLEMLKGLETKVGIAVSGVAGPLGGTKEKPVGTVFIGIKLNKKYMIKRYLFKGDREKIRLRASYEAISSLLKILKRGDV